MVNEYIVLKLDRYKLEHSEMEVIKSDIRDIKEFFNELIPDAAELLIGANSVMASDGSMLSIDGEEFGILIKKQ